MTLQIDSSKAGKYLFLLICLFSPWYYLRWGGFSFSHGSSLSAVDIFLFVGFAYFLMRLNRDLPLAAVLRGFQPHLLALGTCFALMGLLSGFTRVWATSEPISWKALLSGLTQYSFVMLALPLIAAATLSGRKASFALKMIALGHLPPMVLNFVFMRQDVLPEVAFMFVSAGRSIGTYGNANSFAAVLALVLPYYFYLTYAETGRWRWLGIVGGALSLTSLLLTMSFSGFLVVGGCLGANILLFLVWRRHPLRGNGLSFAWPTGIMLALSVVLLGMITFYAPSMATSVTRRFDSISLPNNVPVTDGATASIPATDGATASVPTTDGATASVPTTDGATASVPTTDGTATDGATATYNIGSASQRIELIRRAFLLIRERDGGIFYGHGLRQTGLMDEFAFGEIKLDIHLIYLALWVEGGAVMSLLFIAYLATLLFGCFSRLRDNPAAAMAAGSSVLSFILMGMVLPHIYLRYFWVPMMPAMALVGGCFNFNTNAEDRQ